MNRLSNFQWSFTSALVVSLMAFQPTHGQGKIESLSIEEEIQIDGILNESVWSKAPMVTGFKTFVPDYSKDMEYKTEVFIVNDEDNIYFAFKCYDDPSLIKTSIAARDKIGQDDWICVNLDSFHDQQSLYGLYVNPSGIQRDTRFSNGREDEGVDVVWYSAGQITEEGYVVEIKIPFKSIRYRNGDPVEMGVIFERRISRLSTQGTFPALDPSYGANFLIQSAPLLYENVKKFSLVEVLPAVTYSNRMEDQEGELVRQTSQADFSLTGKYGITSELILDGTYNPDFSQVESDAGQIDENQRFALFFPERRPFFLEGSEIFTTAGMSRFDPVRSLVNTRTIVDPRAATKLTGKIGSNRNTLGAIFALDQIPDSEVLGQTNAKVGILRYRRAFGDDSFVGATYTSRFLDGGYNQIAAIDGQIRLNNASRIEANFIKSFDRDSTNTEVEDDHHLTLKYNYNTRNISFGTSIQDNTQGFSSDVGYVTRTGVGRYNIWLSPKIYPKNSVVKRIDPLLSTTYMLDKESGLWEYSYWLNTRLTLPKNTNISISYNYKTEIFQSQSFDRSNLRASISSQVNKRLRLNASYGRGNKIRYVEDAYQGYGNDISAGFDWQFTDNFNSRLTYIYSDFFREDDDSKDFDFGIIRSRNTYQLNQYLFFRIIVENNSFRNRLSTDFLASFTYIPGTVVHLGYGSLYEKIRWDSTEYVEDDQFHETVRGFFFKASYLFRK